MNVGRTMFVLAVPDLQASAHFYQDSLGFEVHEIGDDGWRMFKRDECRIMAGHCPDAIPPMQLGDHNYFAYIVVDDANSYAQELKEKGVKFVKQIKDEPWGMREFGIRTVDGHRILFGQDI